MIETVAEALGGTGGDVLGGVWLLLVSWAALRARCSRARLNWLGLGVGVAALLSVVPGPGPPGSRGRPVADRVVPLVRNHHGADRIDPAVTERLIGGESPGSPNRWRRNGPAGSGATVAARCSGSCSRSPGPETVFVTVAAFLTIRVVDSARAPSAREPLRSTMEGARCHDHDPGGLLRRQPVVHVDQSRPVPSADPPGAGRPGVHRDPHREPAAVQPGLRQRLSRPRPERSRRRSPRSTPCSSSPRSTTARSPEP